MRHLWTPSLAILALAITACGGDTPDAPEAKTQPPVAETDTSPGQTAAYNPQRNAYFGDLHVHTRNSFDAYIFNVRRTPDDAYRFAKGETVTHPSGFDMTISGGPLDFYTVTDHAEYLGILPAMNDPESPLSQSNRAADMFSMDREKITAAFQSVGASVRNGERYPDMYDEDVMKTVWDVTVDAAEKHYEPGVFTTFAAYEFTSTFQGDGDGGDNFGGGNLHRNVFFKGEAPLRIFSTLDSPNPEDLWDWMDEQRAAGIELISIPHNSNVSNGRMFDTVGYTGDTLTASYAE